MAIGNKRGVGKAAEVEVNSKFGDAGQPQQARREGKERRKDEERETLITLDMVIDNGPFEFSYIYIYIYSCIFLAFNSILRVLHRLSPPYLSSFFTYSHTVINLPNIFTTRAKLDLRQRSRDQYVSSVTDDDGQYTAMAKNTATSDRSSHPPILGSLAAREITQRFAYVALPYPEWRLNLVNQVEKRKIPTAIAKTDSEATENWDKNLASIAQEIIQRHREDNLAQ